MLDLSSRYLLAASLRQPTACRRCIPDEAFACALGIAWTLRATHHPGIVMPAMAPLLL
jgi:hypothetical protein